MKYDTSNVADNVVGGADSVGAAVNDQLRLILDTVRGCENVQWTDYGTSAQVYEVTGMRQRDDKTEFTGTGGASTDNSTGRFRHNSCHGNNVKLSKSWRYAFSTIRVGR